MEMNVRDDKKIVEIWLTNAVYYHMSRISVVITT